MSRPVPMTEQIAGAFVATAIGLLLAAALVHWWCA